MTFSQTYSRLLFGLLRFEMLVQKREKVAVKAATKQFLIDHENIRCPSPAPQSKVILQTAPKIPKTCRDSVYNEMKSSR